MLCAHKRTASSLCLVEVVAVIRGRLIFAARRFHGPRVFVRPSQACGYMRMRPVHEQTLFEQGTRFVAPYNKFYSTVAKDKSMHEQSCEEKGASSRGADTFDIANMKVLFGQL